MTNVESKISTIVLDSSLLTTGILVVPISQHCQSNRFLTPPDGLVPTGVPTTASITTTIPPHIQTIKRMERQSREMEIQLGEDTKTIARQVEQITALNNRNKQLKQFLADSVSFTLPVPSTH